MPFLGCYIRASPPFFIYLLVARALGMSGSSTPITFLDYADCSHEFKCFLCLFIFPEFHCVLEEVLAPSSAVDSISSGLAWRSCLLLDSPILYLFVPGSLFKVFSLYAGPPAALEYSRGAGLCVTHTPYSAPREHLFFSLQFTPSIEGCIFEFTPFFEGCVCIVALSPLPVLIPSFESCAFSCLPSSLSNWRTMPIVFIDFEALIYLTVHFEFSELCLLTPMFQIIVVFSLEDGSHVVSFLWVVHRLVDGYFLDAIRDFLYSRPLIHAP